MSDPAHRSMFGSAASAGDDDDPDSAAVFFTSSPFTGPALAAGTLQPASVTSPSAFSMSNPAAVSPSALQPVNVSEYPACWTRNPAPPFRLVMQPSTSPVGLVPPAVWVNTNPLPEPPLFSARQPFHVVFPPPWTSHPGLPPPIACASQSSNAESV